MKVQVSEFIVRYMERLGIECVFGMPGAHILPVYDCLYDSSIKSVLAKHEQGAAFMAGGYARVSGGVGACITTAGPGATNLVTGIANAYADRQPVLIITGESSTEVFGKGGLQESSGEGGAIDQGTLFRGITRYHRLVERVDYLPSVLNQASNALLSDCPGPVLLSFPFNVQQESIDLDLLDTVRTTRHASPRRRDDPLLDDVVQRLLSARNPVILAGYGCIQSGAHEAVKQLSDVLSLPVATTLKGKGIVDERSERSLGTLGVTSGGRAYEYIVEHADLLLVLGATFNERTSYLWDRQLPDNRKIIQIDRNPEQIEKVFRADVAVVGDVRDALEGILARLRGGTSATAPVPGRQLDAIDGDAMFTLFEDHHFTLVEQFFSRFNQHFTDDNQIFDDNIIFAQNLLGASPATSYHPNSGISSLGHAIPAAIGARFASQRQTFAILGDGGFQMCCMELMTAVNYRIPLTVILFNNGTLGLIRKNQHQRYEDRFIDCDFTNPDYAQLAAAFGIAYQCIRHEVDIDEAFGALDFDAGINLIEIIIDRDAFPAYNSRR
ncbi:thiamine pyrophosphate-binding protein [Thiohalomonas denitrificans]|uniref:Acetolactate synthase-1/2/3 large subunit n=1 Tax=Thiohalomonas denitrificans TaxID=415747 RepID=A0A1G5QVL1_9GAMM|nr:thiamine pyrophosphate-binding protein [Thiohalomonas denitrificans]SCZ65580.1 acetolactate synthase-1/2/3 large subunit [Thiohalomonas denitrificans]